MACPTGGQAPDPAEGAVPAAAAFRTRGGAPAATRVTPGWAFCRLSSPRAGAAVQLGAVGGGAPRAVAGGLGAGRLPGAVAEAVAGGNARWSRGGGTLLENMLGYGCSPSYAWTWQWLVLPCHLPVSSACRRPHDANSQVGQGRRCHRCPGRECGGRLGRQLAEAPQTRETTAQGQGQGATTCWCPWGGSDSGNSGGQFPGTPPGPGTTQAREWQAGGCC